MNTIAVAYSVKDAAAVAGVSQDVIRAAIKRGDLIAHYPTSRAVILRAELEDWLKSTPTEGKAA